jgi:hypothetical protein
VPTEILDQRARPGRRYLPWLGWFTPLAALLGLSLCALDSGSALVKCVCIVSAVLLLGNYRLICQEFVLRDADATVELLARSRCFGRVSIKVRKAGAVSNISLVKLGYTTQQMPFEIVFGTVIRRFTLLYFANTRYFALSEQVDADSPAATCVENSLVFQWPV